MLTVSYGMLPRLNNRQIKQAATNNENTMSNAAGLLYVNATYLSMIQIQTECMTVAYVSTTDSMMSTTIG